MSSKAKGKQPVPFAKHSSNKATSTYLCEIFEIQSLKFRFLFVPAHFSLIASRLDSLLRHLTISEIRRIRVQLGSKPVLDVCDFPSELITRIFAQLPLEDLFTLRSVSRRWRNILSSPEFCREMIKEHFEPQWKRTNKHIWEIDDGDNDDRAMEWFQHSANARVRRQRGQYHSMVAYWYGFSQQVPQAHYECQYSNGRLGLRYRDSMIQVKSLRSSCVDQFYTDENREPIKEFLLSDRYLIGLKTSP